MLIVNNKTVIDYQLQGWPTCNQIKKKKLINKQQNSLRNDNDLGTYYSICTKYNISRTAAKKKIFVSSQ